MWPELDKINNINIINASSSISNSSKRYTSNRSNGLRVYRCIKTGYYILIEISNNRIYRLIGPELIKMPINNISNNWQVIRVYRDCSEYFIKGIYAALQTVKRKNIK